MAEESLKEKTAKGLFWGGLSNGIQQLLNLFFGVFLARLLTPADYGMVGMLTIFSLIATTLQESGFTAALANKKEIKYEDYNSVFWFSILTSLCIYIVLYFFAPLIAKFFNQPQLIPLARYSFLCIVISSTGIAQNAYMFCNLMVKQKAISVIIGLFISGIVGIILAYYGFSYWGIVTQNITYVSVVMICYWLFSPWRPTFNLNFSPLKEMLAFSCKILTTNIFIHLNNNIFSIILGKFYTEKEVGFYNQANKWNYMGFSLINGMINGVAQPILAQVSETKERQLFVFRKMMKFTSFFSVPCMLGLSLIAPELISIAITDKWLTSVQLLQLLSLYGAFIPIVSLCTNLIISKGKSNIFMWNTIIQGAIQLLVLYTIYPYGIQIMIITYVIINILWLFIWQYFVWEEINYRFVHFLADVLPFFFASIAIMGATYFFTRPITNIYILFASKIIVAATLYIFIMWLSKCETFKESTTFIKSKIKKHSTQL